MYIISHFQGNVHEAMHYVNKLKCRNHLFQVVDIGRDVVLIFKIVSREDMRAARAELGLPSQDDPNG